MEQAVQAPLAFLCVFAPLRETYLTSEADERAKRRKAAKRRWSKQVRHHSPSFASLRLCAILTSLRRQIIPPKRRKAAKRRWRKQFRHRSPSFASLRLCA